MNNRLLLLFVLLIPAFSGCRTYYQKQQEFHDHFSRGRLEQASRIMETDRLSKRKRNRLLYLLNQGVVLNMLGEYEKSNELFEEAYILGEDYRKDFLDQTLALFSNPNITEYKGDYFELIMIHYYKVMNFIQMEDFDAALVECRRMDIKLNELEDLYKSENKYTRDAFVHNLMGIIYDAKGDYNNAFIAYRNAYEIYNEDYTSLFNIGAPPQLRYDLVRSAYRSGLYDQAAYYEDLFELNYQYQDNNGKGELVFFWQNGLGPVKEEWSIDFMLVKGHGGTVNFVNEEYDLSFPFPLSGKSEGDLSDLKVIRLALPAYSEREPVFTDARLRYNDSFKPLILAQDINAIAFKSLSDRLIKELGNALLRLAVKQVTEERIRKENETIGAIAGLLGAISEQADTRNWQTLPHSISYTRMFLPEGNNELEFQLLLPDGKVALSIPVDADIEEQKTTFINIHTLDSKPPSGIRPVFD